MVALGCRDRAARPPDLADETVTLKSRLTHSTPSWTAVTELAAASHRHHPEKVFYQCKKEARISSPHSRLPVRTPTPRHP